MRRSDYTLRRFVASERGHLSWRLCLWDFSPRTVVASNYTEIALACWWNLWGMVALVCAFGGRCWWNPIGPSLISRPIPSCRPSVGSIAYAAGCVVIELLEVRCRFSRWRWWWRPDQHRVRATLDRRRSHLTCRCRLRCFETAQPTTRFVEGSIRRLVLLVWELPAGHT